MTERFVDTSSLAGIERASDTGWRPQTNVDTSRLSGIRKASFYEGYNPVALVPSEDYSFTGMQARLYQERQAIQDRLDRAAEAAAQWSEYNYTPVATTEAALASRQEGSPYDEVRSAYLAMLMSYNNRQASNLTRYPGLAAAALEAKVDEREVAQLINYAEADRAAEQVLAAMALGASNPYAVDESERRVKNIMSTAGPVMAIAIWDVVAAKLEAMDEDAPDEQTRSLYDNILFGVGKALEAAFFIPIVLAEGYQQAIRASEYGSFVENIPETSPDPIGSISLDAQRIQNIFEYWNDVQEGSYNQQLLDAAKKEYNPLTVEIILDIERKSREGDPDPLISVLSERSNDPAALEILRPLYYEADDSSRLAEAARAVNNADLSNTGQTVLSSYLRETGLGSQARDRAAGALNAYVTLGQDPTLYAGKVRAAYLSARYAIAKLAPGASAAGVRTALNQRPTRRYFERLFNDLDRYEELLKTDAAAASMLRERIRRQYYEVSDDLVEELRTRGIRNIDDLADWTIETNAAFLIMKGSSADELIRTGPAEFRSTLADEILGSGSALVRTPMMPRMSPGRVARMNFSRAAGVVSPKKRGKEVIDKGFGGTSDVDEIAATMMDPAGAMQIGAIERGGILTSGAYGKRVDRFFRWFSSLPNKGYVSIADASDSRVVYRWARSMLSRQTATYIADAFRRGDPSQRYNIIVGLNRTSAAAKGLDLMDETVLARADELTKATSSGTKFAASVRQPVDESSITVVVNGNTRKIQFADDFVPPMQTSLSAESVQVIERVEIGGMVDTARLIARVSLNKDAKSHNIWVRELTKFRKNQDPDFNQFGPIDDATLRETEKIADEIMGEWYARTQQILVDRGYPEYVRVWRTADPSFGDPAKGLVSVTLHSRPVDTLGGDAYEYLIPRSRILYDNQGMVGQRIPDKALPGGTPFVEREMEAFVRIEDLKRLDPNAKPTPVARGGRDLQTPEPLDVVVQPTTQATDNYINPSNFNGVEKALFGWQTASHVAIPSMRDVEMLARWRSSKWAPEWLQNTPQRVTDYWSLGTLYGLRYSIRNAAEDLWFYAVITGGNLADLYRGRRISTALRETRGRQRETATSGGSKSVQALGMINRRMRSIGDFVAEKNDPVSDLLSRFIRANLDQEQVAAAHAAALKGDFEPMRQLAALALTKARFTTLNKVEEDYVLDLVSGPFGLRILDDLAETGKNINSGGAYIDDALPVTGTDAMGVNLATVPREGRVESPTGDFFDLPLDGTRPEAFVYWDQGINGAILGDGPAGQIAVAYIDDVEEAVRRVVDEINTDPTNYGYAWRFAAVRDDGVETFARRKVLAIRGFFSDADGNLNVDLWRRVVDGDRNVRAFDIGENGERIWRITPQVLRQVPKSKRPTYASGQTFGVVPTASGIGAFADRTWGWMGEQYARISREPIFIANYLSQRRALAGYQAQMAAQVGEKAARRHVSRLAEDRAYAFTLSYMDNPQNRSLMAWKVRNVARYYRATEDFYRRVARAGKNYPIGLWRTQLVYDVLDDTGFVYTDDNGDKYFMYPGTQPLMSALNAAIGTLMGTEMLDMEYPFMLGGKVNMLAPSADPNQAFPAVAGPFAAFTWKTTAARFPALDKFNRYVLGQYGENYDKSVSGILIESFMPAGISRVVRALDDDERESVLAGAAKDAMAIAIANDLVPADDNDPGWADAMASVNNMAWSLVVVRFALSMIVPASPQRYNDNVTEYARMQGVVDFRNAFLDLVQKKSDAGAENPFGEALADWYKFNPDLFPYTISKTEEAAEVKGEIRQLAPLKYAREVSEWWDDNQSVIKEYPQTAFFLAPQVEGFSWEGWGLVKGEGFRVSKDLDTFMRDALSAIDEFHYYATYEDYQRDIDALDPRIPEQYSQIRDLEEQRSADLKYIKERNPFTRVKLSDKNQAQLAVLADEALPEVKTMVDDLFKSTPSEEWEGSAAQAIRNSILTYIDYKTELNMITGMTREDNQRKREIRFAMEQDFDVLSEQNLNARLFIKNVLMRNPGIEGL